MSAKHVETTPENTTGIFIPLNDLKNSPKNARKTLRSDAVIEVYAASIAAKGILQNLVVEPEFDEEKAATGCPPGHAARRQRMLSAASWGTESEFGERSQAAIRATCLLRSITPSGYVLRPHIPVIGSRFPVERKRIEMVGEEDFGKSPITRAKSNICAWRQIDP